MRSIERLVNKGLLGEFLTDEGAKWFAQQENSDGFITALEPLGKGLSARKRNHPVIAYYVPFSIQEGELLHV